MALTNLKLDFSKLFLLRIILIGSVYFLSCLISLKDIETLIYFQNLAVNFLTYLKSVFLLELSFTSFTMFLKD